MNEEEMLRKLAKIKKWLKSPKHKGPLLVEFANACLWAGVSQEIVIQYLIVQVKEMP